MKKAFYFVLALASLFMLCGELSDKFGLFWVVAYYGAFLFILLFSLRQIGVFCDIKPFVYTYGAPNAETGEKIKQALQAQGCRDVDRWLYHKPAGGVFYYDKEDKVVKHTNESAVIEYIVENGNNLKID